MGEFARAAKIRTSTQVEDINDDIRTCTEARDRKDAGRPRTDYQEWVDRRDRPEIGARSVRDGREVGASCVRDLFVRCRDTRFAYILDEDSDVRA